MQPKYGYGDDGDAGANVPAGATLSVELEVVSWYDVEDVSTDKDGGVLMTKIVESAEANDYKNPKDMGTAKMHLKVTLEDGTVVKDTRADNGDEPVSHQLDETIPICPAVEMALKKMKKGGHSKLKISPKHGFGDGNAELGVPGGATVLEASWLRPGTTVVAVGSDQPTKQEIPVDVLATSKYVCDLVGQTSQIGELRSAIEAGAMTFGNGHCFAHRVFSSSS